ncbi:MAG TPA: dynamin family protein, partial [Acidimicrobiia bacterium]|nr:dynamin family protein [Acidimicrobiia bacterium]
MSGEPGALAVVDLGRQAAGAYGRPDLAQRLDITRRRLTDPAVHVMVVGEFKQGKSSLVNALVESTVCPVDDDVATAVPTAVRFADTPSADVVHEAEGSAEPQIDAIPFTDLPVYASEAGNPGNERRVRSVEVGIPSSVLSGGLVLVDTPGVGGLGSVHSAITMAALPMADALVFVTDASQELSAPEFDFLQRARDLCPNVVVALTKIDFYGEWRRI